MHLQSQNHEGQKHVTRLFLEGRDRTRVRVVTWSRHRKIFDLLNPVHLTSTGAAGLRLRWNPRGEAQKNPSRSGRPNSWWRSR